MSRNWLRRVYIAALGRRSKRGIMNCSAKQLNGIGLPSGWTVRVIFGDGSLSTTFTIEELKDIAARGGISRVCGVAVLGRLRGRKVYESCVTAKMFLLRNFWRSFEVMPTSRLRSSIVKRFQSGDLSFFLS
jgi:hypothetical protein